MSKMIFWTVRYTNTQIQIHKYKYKWFKDVKNDNTKGSDPRYDTLSDKGYTSVPRCHGNSDASQDALKLLQDSSFLC